MSSKPQDVVSGSSRTEPIAPWRSAITYFDDESVWYTRERAMRVRVPVAYDGPPLQKPAEVL